jgi:hypothetical protein
MGLFTKKSIARLQEEAGTATLHRVLGPVNLTTLGIGSVIGTGIFVLTGTAASPAGARGAGGARRGDGGGGAVDAQADRPHAESAESTELFPLAPPAFVAWATHVRGMRIDQP